MSQERTQPHILIIEDQPPISDTISLFLGSEGFRVSIVSEGNAAIDILNKEPVDVIILDLSTPEMSGFDLRTWLKGHERFKNIPRALLSAMPMEHLIHREELRGELKIRKPFDIYDLLKKVRDLANPDSAIRNDPSYYFNQR